MLTALIGNEIINCYDGTHTKEQLKKWSKKKILLCPACEKPYEYCHGHVKDPYFRHMDKEECEDKFSESETEEHLTGKRDLYEWIKEQDGVENVILEAWIPETKQRPDIMFNFNGKKYVIEYQCSPIASEYLERHELYKTAGIHDLWICGTEKYLKENMKEKFIEQYSIGFYNPTEKIFIFSKKSEVDNFIRNVITRVVYKKIPSYDQDKFYYASTLSNLIYFNNEIIPSNLIKVDFNDAITIHNYREYLKHKLEIDMKKRKEHLISRIINRYSNYNKITFKNNNGIVLTDQVILNNSHYCHIDYCNSTYVILKDIAHSLYLLKDKRKYFFMMKHLELVFKNKINGDYTIGYTTFNDGECIDIQYDNYTIRNIISNLNLKISIHDYNGYRRKNYIVYEFYNYQNYKDLIHNLIIYDNKIFNNNLKIQNVINKLKKYNNKNWSFNYQKTVFNLTEIFLEPVDNDGYRWNSIGTFKINANLDKSIDIENTSEEEIVLIIKKYFTKRMISFYKTGINNYIIGDMRLMINRRVYE